jgi:hypothetical protein
LLIRHIYSLAHALPIWQAAPGEHNALSLSIFTQAKPVPENSLRPDVAISAICELQPGAWG